MRVECPNKIMIYKSIFGFLRGERHINRNAIMVSDPLQLEAGRGRYLILTTSQFDHGAI